MKTRNLRGDGASLKDLAKQTPMITGAVTLGIGALGAGQADAALVIQDINLTSGDGEINNDPFTFDLDQDGNDDFFVLNETPFQKHAFIQSTQTLVKAVANPVNKVTAFGLLEETDGMDYLFSGGNSIFTDEDGYTTLFGPGDEVDSGDGPTDTYSEFFDAAGGPFSQIGDTGYIGLQLELETGTHYGWLEVTRGSITGGQAGFQTTAGAPAPIPGGGMVGTPAGVPEPGGIPMLAAGAAGIALLKRRRKQQKSA